MDRNKVPVGEGREYILAVATESFLNEGFSQVAISAIAKQSGLTRASVYGHFGSKTSLGLAVLDGLGAQISTSVVDEKSARSYLELAFALFSATLRDAEALHSLATSVSAILPVLEASSESKSVKTMSSSLRLLLEPALDGKPAASNNGPSSIKYAAPLDANLSVTIHDVALHSGTSAKTVSRVINEATGVASSTRLRVLASMRELKYMPNAYAQRLSRPTVDVVGLLVDDLSTFPFAVDIIRGAQTSAQEQGKTLFIVDYESDNELLTKVLRQFKSWQIESLIFASPHHKRVSPRLLEGFGDVVLVNCVDVDGAFASIVPDEEQGAYIATELLIRHGHRQIGFINGDPSFPATPLRLKGYKKALKSAGIPFDVNLVRNGDWWQESGYSLMRDLMQLPSRPSAVFCGNDWMAMGAYSAATELGLSIPHDVSIVGFDDREVISAHMFPKLSTIALPYFEMGQSAMQRIHLGNIAATAETIPCRLVERESVK